MRFVTRTVLVCTVAMLIGGCQGGGDGNERPEAVTPTREAITYYGRMILVDHRGPKAQIHLRSRASALWFSQVRDAIAFTLSPEEPNDIAAIYVTDMAEAAGWDSPQHWVPAREAVYVIDSDRRGGMGALEAVPFSRRQAALAFVDEHGGEIVTWADMPDAYILERSVEAVAAPAMEHGGAGGVHSGH
ncbi:nitrous oxide reductase accessory protein NosL [Arhodomonas sp. AD133]|uniref:nitrous oxide reductase accessory protein NosL n=1 Tax=Arhodomonas sp. AD133 TaxID=3415009 RepID=UPI003EBEFF56